MKKIILLLIVALNASFAFANESVLFPIEKIYTDATNISDVKDKFIEEAVVDICIKHLVAKDNIDAEGNLIRRYPFFNLLSVQCKQETKQIKCTLDGYLTSNANAVFNPGWTMQFIYC
jgi:hypothetical protein